MKSLTLALCLLICLLARAQLLKNLKEKVESKAKSRLESKKQEAKTKARHAVLDELDQLKAEFDSTDFDYAVLIGNPEFGNNSRIEKLPATKKEVESISVLFKGAGYHISILSKKRLLKKT
ncbi:MAG: hypothetical protein N2747_03325 [Chitinophagaceae bacterium]|nr:hypothetical protein [Chitinophagaceae bacterium]